MGFRCEQCKEPQPAGVKPVKKAVTRPDGSIAGEMNICPACETRFEKGQALAQEAPAGKPRRGDGLSLKAGLAQLQRKWDAGARR